jgi:hypothetical protein
MSEITGRVRREKSRAVSLDNAAAVWDMLQAD